ncbi:MAG: fasciclin domain-containing protein [Bacteroidetes bacterium]|nr:fasciclin domain-containing protein [Bacteroidota bacterium]
MRKIILTVIFLFSSLLMLGQQMDTAKREAFKTRNIGGTAMSSTKNIAENLSHARDFSILVTALDSARLTENLTSGTFTFFAPSNKAFEKLATGLLDTLLLPSHRADLVKLLNYHIVAGKLTSKGIARQIKAGNGQASLQTLSGGTLTARINENRNIVLTDEHGGESVVTQFDVEQSNGILHVVGSVLMPNTTP